MLNGLTTLPSIYKKPLCVFIIVTPLQAVFPGFDPEVYNADGTLRTVHQMPNPNVAWEEAQKARYIRTKDLLERDKELSVQEIFAKDSN